MWRSLLLPAWIASLVPTLVAAQSLAGAVRDASGALLPDVKVEAASAALIERVRSTATDGAGHYRINDLPPSRYIVTFTLRGFITVVRDGVDVMGGGVTTINAEMQVRSLKESITVTGDTPVVDVQSTRRQQVLSGEIIRALPTSRGHGNYIAAVPALTGTGFNSSAQPTTNFFSSRGGRSTEGAIQIDGMNVGTPGFGAGVSGYMYDIANSAEVQVSISGGLGESERGGPTFNIIPKTGGNVFSGTVFASFAGNRAQWTNIDDELRALGFADPPALHKAWDTNFALGGPIVRDRLWFFGNTRLVGSHQDTQNQWGNKNAGDPNLWTWAKDERVRVRTAESKRINSLRFTWQATPRNQFGFYIDYTNNCSGSSYVRGGDDCREPGNGWTASGPSWVPALPTTSPESGALWDDRAKILQAHWLSPISSRVLLESRFSSFFTKWGDVRPHGALTDFIPVTEQSTATGIPFANYIYRGWSAAPSTDQQHTTWRATLSYVTGSHSIKVGYQAGYLMTRNTTLVGRQISYRFNNGEPNQLSQRVGPNRVTDSLRYNAVFIQDQWTRHRLTLQGGLRYETARSWAPADSNGIIAAHQFGGPLLFPRTEGVRGYHDITPRAGIAYDVFGTGRTALKVSLGKYTQGASTSEAYIINNPGGTLVTTVNRAWTDPNGNRVAECDFMDPGPGGECGEWQNLNWGSAAQTTRVNPDTLEGWGVRNYDWQFTAGVQQQIAPHVALNVSYNRRWWGNFFVTHNRALGPDDYDTVTLVAPQHPLLPGGGGYPVTFLTRNTRSPVGASDPYYTTTRDFGEETHYWHGVEVSFNARMPNGLLFQGGTSIGRGVNDTCEVQIARFGRPERLVGSNQIPDCAFTEPWLTSVRGLATYIVPKIDVMVSAILRSQPSVQPGTDDASDAARRRGVATNGASLAANYQMTAAQFLAATGRALTPGLTSQTVNLLLQGERYGERVNVVDLRLAKILRFAGKRSTIGLDVYNLFNTNTPSEYEQVFDPATNGARWMQPTSVLVPRFARVNVVFDF